MPDKIKLVYYGDAPNVATGFGKVSSNILPVLYDSGEYEIYCFGVNYLNIPHKYPFQIYGMLPNPQNDPYGREKAKQIIPQLEFDVGFFLQDSFIMTFIPEIMQQLRQRGRRSKILAYFPVDGKPWPEWIKAMSAADIPVTYTEWGKKQCINVCPEIGPKLQVVPHGINLKEFFPLPPEKRMELRKMFFGPHADKFILINVNRNQPRKDIPACLMAFKEFIKECPKSVLYLHCAEKDVGWDLKKVCEHLGLEIGKDILFPMNFNVNSGFPVEIVNQLYNSADVSVTTTIGEGWGLGITESFATLTPVIGPSNTSLTELLADGRGFLCRSGDTPNMKICLTYDNEVIRPRINIEDMVRHLKRLYENRELGKKVAIKAHKWVTDNLIWERDIVPRFDTYLKQLYEESKRSEESVSSKEEGSGWKRGQIV